MQVRGDYTLYLKGSKKDLEDLYGAYMSFWETRKDVGLPYEERQLYDKNFKEFWNDVECYSKDSDEKDGQDPFYVKRIHGLEDFYSVFPDCCKNVFAAELKPLEIAYWIDVDCCEYGRNVGSHVGYKKAGDDFICPDDSGWGDDNLGQLPDEEWIPEDWKHLVNRTSFALSSMNFLFDKSWTADELTIAQEALKEILKKVPVPVSENPEPGFTYGFEGDNNVIDIARIPKTSKAFPKKFIEILTKKPMVIDVDYQFGPDGVRGYTNDTESFYIVSAEDNKPASRHAWSETYMFRDELELDCDECDQPCYDEEEDDIDYDNCPYRQNQTYLETIKCAKKTGKFNVDGKFAEFLTDKKVGVCGCFEQNSSKRIQDVISKSAKLVENNKDADVIICGYDIGDDFDEIVKMQIPLMTEQQFYANLADEAQN